MRGKVNQAFIERSVFAAIQAEADDKFPVETGGVLLGTYSSDRIVITSWVGPGPKAKHTSCSFQPDYSFQQEMAANAFHLSDGEIVYLGDWHSHPNGAAYLSSKDKVVLESIAHFLPSKISTPIMVVLGGTPLSWDIKVWRFSSYSTAHTSTENISPLDLVMSY